MHDYDYRQHCPLGMGISYIKDWTTLSLSTFNWFAENMVYGQSRSKAYNKDIIGQAVVGPPTP